MNFFSKNPVLNSDEHCRRRGGNMGAEEFKKYRQNHSTKGRRKNLIRTAVRFRAIFALPDLNF